jgi:pyruvate/2-oxoglutarate dehydrogenase complex dihydrolipoamide dehydrogenase (E3) component
VKINEHLETTVPGVYAIGDAAGNPAFTHISYDDFRILRDLLLGTGRRTTADRPVPYVVFIDPQLGRIGLGEDEARKAGRNVRVVTLPMDYVSRAIEVGETRGFMKAVVDGDSDEILGATVLGVEGGEIMAMLEIAMIGHVPYTTLRDAVFSHPTLSESLNTLFMRMER